MDDQLVGRWNRVAEVWRGNPDFREAVLRYATQPAAWRDPASPDLWPEVVYPLIERARWQRRLRPRFEAPEDLVFDRVLHAPDAGLRFDRAFRGAVPEPGRRQARRLARRPGRRATSSTLGAAAPPTRQDDDRDPESALGLRSGVSLHELATDLAPDPAGAEGWSA